jgi:hypothetical protein
VEDLAHFWALAPPRHELPVEQRTRHLERPMGPVGVEALNAGDGCLDDACALIVADEPLPFEMQQHFGRECHSGDPHRCDLLRWFQPGHAFLPKTPSLLPFATSVDLGPFIDTGAGHRSRFQIASKLDT